jgi:predicted nucleotidyltransferase
MTTRNFIESRAVEIDALGRHHRIERLALFGSALRDDFDPEKSDLDFAVGFSNMSLEERATVYFGLLDDLEALFNRRVDFVKIRAVRNPYLSWIIEVEQEIISAEKVC